jgi:hypothetical protein
MMRESDYDILRWRTVEETKAFYDVAWRSGYVANTEWNWRRRRGLPEEGDLHGNGPAGDESTSTLKNSKQHGFWSRFNPRNKLKRSESAPRNETNSR